MLKEIFSFFGQTRQPDEAIALYAAIVGQARNPAFYRDLGVPDTLDGRFDMIILHAFLVSRRLKAINTEPAQRLNQALFDLMFADMDNSLREIGIGDLSVGKKVKAMAQAYYGRIEAYDAGLAEPEGDMLASALRRNLYGTVESVHDGGAGMAAYLRNADAQVARISDRDILHGRVNFPAP